MNGETVDQSNYNPSFFNVKSCTDADPENVGRCRRVADSVTEKIIGNTDTAILA